MCPTLISSSAFVYNGTHTIIIKVENQQHLLNFAKLILSLQKKGIPFEMSLVYMPRNLKEVNMATIYQAVVIKILENVQYQLH